MPDGALILLFALEFEDNGLCASAIRHNRALYERAAHIGAGLHGLAVEHRQYLIKLDFRADLARYGLNLQKFARSGAILLPACFNNCVHTDSLLWILLKNLRTFSLLQQAYSEQPAVLNF